MRLFRVLTVVRSELLVSPQKRGTMDGSACSVKCGQYRPTISRYLGKNGAGHNSTSKACNVSATHIACEFERLV